MAEKYWEKNHTIKTYGRLGEIMSRPILTPLFDARIRSCREVVVVN